MPSEVMAVVEGSMRDAIKAPTMPLDARLNRNEREAMSCACGSRLSNAWSQRRRTDRQAQRKLSARHVKEAI